MDYRNVADSINILDDHLETVEDIISNYEDVTDAKELIYRSVGMLEVLETLDIVSSTLYTKYYERIEMLKIALENARQDGSRDEQ